MEQSSKCCTGCGITKLTTAFNNARQVCKQCGVIQRKNKHAALVYKIRSRQPTATPGFQFSREKWESLVNTTERRLNALNLLTNKIITNKIASLDNPTLELACKIETIFTCMSSLLSKNKLWRIKNPGKARALYAARYAIEIKATPVWLSEGDKQRITETYDEAIRLTRETGEPHQVDHIVPLKGKFVSGLHVPWNLQVITAVENLKKGNRINN